MIPISIGMKRTLFVLRPNVFFGIIPAMKTKAICCTFLIACVAAAETISLKSPDGRNEIRLSTEPALAYSVVRDGVVRVADSPIALNVEGRPLCGGAAKVKSSDSRLVSGSFATPIYKKATVDLAGMEKTVEFEGGWSIVLHARNDGVAYRFKTAFDAPKVKVLDEVASLAFPSNGLVTYAGIARNGHQSSWESVYAKQTVGELQKALGESKILYLPLLVQYPDGKLGVKWLAETPPPGERLEVEVPPILQ